MTLPYLETGVNTAASRALVDVAAGGGGAESGDSGRRVNSAGCYGPARHLVWKEESKQTR